MRITKVELYDKYYSTYPDKAKLYRGDTEMPNHCHNRVTFYSDNVADVEQLKKIFQDENTFGQIIPEPDWANTPLMSSDVKGTVYDRGKVGELPMPDGTFQSTGRHDDRWYDWRLANWDTKWDAYDVVVTDEDPECTEIEFNTAWSPPTAICNAIREQYEDVSVSWFYDEPGMEIAGYL
mgnify:FL=1